MLSIVRHTRRALLGLLLTPVLVSQAHADVAGATAGQFAVQGGAATYTIPLTLPPGLGEMKPELSLVYNSNGGDGPMGQGWSVSGLSAITLCPQTVAQDGVYVPATKSTTAANQRHCLDGQRLVKTSGTYGAAPLVMRTEVDTFARVTVPSWSTVPTSFVVNTKAGQEMQYGAVASARSHDAVSGTDPAIAWFVNKISDAKKNTILFTYTRGAAVTGATPETLISRIDYTGNDTASLAPYASVNFNYGTRTTPSYYYVGGYRFQRSSKLLSIQTKVNSAVVRTYKLNYGVLSRTGAEIVTSIQECAGPAGSEECLPSTQFAWNQNDTGVWSENTAIGGSWGGADWVRTGDFNGDGLTDIASPDGPLVRMQLAKPFGGFESQMWITQANWTTAAALLVGDFDGDGRADLAFPSGNSVRIKYSRPAIGQFVDVVHTFASLPWGPSTQTFVAEMNGDGMADIVSFPSAILTPGLVLIKNSTSSGFTQQSWSRSYGAFGSSARDNFAADLNGDGITDFASAQRTDNTSYDYVQYYIANPVTRAFSLETVVTPILDSSDKRLRWLADFDGDGLSEIGLVFNNAAVLNAYPPTSRGVASFSRSLPAAIPDSEKDFTWSFDFNGDGTSDVITRVGSVLKVYQIKASGYELKTASLGALTWGTAANTNIGDFNGDGLMDIASRTSGSSIAMAYSRREAGVTSSYVPSGMSKPAQPEAISQITSGEGAIVQIDYRTMGQAPAGNTAYDPAVTLPAGESIVAAPIWLVHEVWASHGAGPATATRGTQYQYLNLHMGTSGRGVLGFEAEVVRDLLTGDYEVTQFETSWPKNGMIKRKDSYLADGTRTALLEQTHSVSTPVVGGPSYPYVSASTQTSFNEAGGALTVTESQFKNIDAYGNFGRVDVTTRDPSNVVWSTKVTTNTYLPADTANWILGRLSNVSVEHSASAMPSITKASAFTYYPNGLLETETVEPGLVGTSAWLKTSYEYDAFGHKSKVTVEGVGYNGSARTSRVTQNAVSTASLSSNILVTTTTNAKGHVSTQQMSLKHGGVIWAQDPNGIAVATAYDSFGRKTQQSQGSAIWTKWAYEGAQGQAANAVQKITRTDSAGGGSVVYQDLMGRTVQKDTLALDGRTITETTKFDEQGRVVEARRPAFDAYSGAPVYTTYDDRGRIIEVNVPASNGGRASTYYAYNGLETTVTDPAGVQRHEVKNALGQVESVSDGSGSSSVTYGYDATGNLWRTIDGIGQTTSIQYDVRGRKVRMLDPAMGDWQYGYNSFGELEWQRDAKNQDALQLYDALGRMTSRSEAGDPVATTWTYDPANGKGKIGSVTGKDGYAEAYLYNAQSLLQQVSTTIKNRGSLETFVNVTAYDDQNRVLQETRPGGFVVENVYNERGYLVAVRSPKVSGEGSEMFTDAALQARISEILNLIPTYQAAANNTAQQLASYQAAANAWTLEAANLRATTLANASAADLQYIAAAEAAAAQYQGYVNELQPKIDAWRATIATLDRYADFYISLESQPYTQAAHWKTLFDARVTGLQGQIASIDTIADANETLRNQYATTAALNEANADARTAQILSSQQTTLDQLQAQTNAALAQVAALQEQLDAENAALARLASQLTMLQANSADTGHITWWRADTVDAEGRISQEVLGNGLITRRTYDPATGQLLEIKTGGAGVGTTDNDLQDVGYQYDVNDNVQYRWDHNIGLQTNYLYDSLDRLTSAQSLHSTASSLNWTKGYSYDALGNMDGHTRNGTSVGYTYQTQNITSANGFATQRKRLTNVSDVGNLTYDANGNVLTSGNRTLTWDAANYPLTVSDGTTSATYTYGPARNRLTKVENKAGRLWEGVYAPGYERTRVTGGTLGVQIENRYAIVVSGRLVATRLLLVARNRRRRRERVDPPGRVLPRGCFEQRRAGDRLDWTHHEAVRI